jgi:hypothetical protein
LIGKFERNRLAETVGCASDQSDFSFQSHDGLLKYWREEIVTWLKTT